MDTIPEFFPKIVLKTLRDLVYKDVFLMVFKRKRPEKK